MAEFVARCGHKKERTVFLLDYHTVFSARRRSMLLMKHSFCAVK